MEGFKEKNSSLKKRIFSALILLPLFLLFLFKAPSFLLWMVASLVLLLSFYELSRMFSFPGKFYFSGFLFLLFFSFLFYFLNSENFFFFLFFYMFLIFFASFLLFLSKTPAFLGSLFFPYIVSIFYLLLTLAPIFYFFKINLSRWYLFYFFSVIFASDTGAYFTGKFLGKHPFFPAFSPKKTWEGFLGGLFSGILVSIILAKWLNLFSLKDSLLLGIFLGISEALGDLFESALKRFCGVKDSGNLIPGHGGLLDRIDGVLFALPVYFFALYLLGIISIN